MTALTRAQLLSAVTANPPALKSIDGLGDIYVKKLTVAEQGELSKSNEKTDNVTSSLLMVTYSLCDENGTRLFSNNDIDELGKMNAEYLTAIINVISEINGFDVKLNDIKKN